MGLPDQDVVRRVIARHRTTSEGSDFDWRGVSVATNSSVFNPFLAPSGPVMCHIAGSSFFRGKTVLDVGCGSGIPSALFAREGGAASVVAVDLNRAAVECAMENARRFDVQTRVEVRHGDLLAPIRYGEVFDIVVADLPFADGRPSDVLETAFFDPDLNCVQRFLSDAERVLAPGGILLFAWSSLAIEPWPLPQMRILSRGELRRGVSNIELALVEFGREQAPACGLEAIKAVWESTSLWSSVKSLVDEALTEAE